MVTQAGWPVSPTGPAQTWERRAPARPGTSRSCDGLSDRPALRGGQAGTIAAADSFNVEAGAMVRAER